MQKYRDVDGDIVKLKLFPFSLRGKAKDWLLSLAKYICTRKKNLCTPNVLNKGKHMYTTIMMLQNV
jgi:hypothetical protein